MTRYPILAGVSLTPQQQAWAMEANNYWRHLVIQYVLGVLFPPLGTRHAISRYPKPLYQMQTFRPDLDPSKKNAYSPSCQV